MKLLVKPKPARAIGTAVRLDLKDESVRNRPGVKFMIRGGWEQWHYGLVAFELNNKYLCMIGLSTDRTRPEQCTVVHSDLLGDEGTLLFCALPDYTGVSSRNAELVEKLSQELLPLINSLHDEIGITRLESYQGQT